MILKQTKLQRVINIAHEVRSWAEHIQRSLPTDKRAFGHDLTGMCAICSAELANRLISAGFKPRLMVGRSHTFVWVGGYIVDVTATQFGHPDKVVVKLRPAKGSFWYWDGATSIRPGDKAKLEEKFQSWPPHQNPVISLDKYKDVVYTSIEEVTA